MIIGIEKSLEGIRNYLEGLYHYEIYCLGEYNGPMDVIIYKDEKSIGDFNKYQYDSITNALSGNEDISNGTLMIKATHKTGEEIHELLNARFCEQT